jgi:poly(A) polymerase
VSLPRRFGTPMQEIWALQARLSNTRGKRPKRLLAHPRFRAAYDFLLLRAAAGEVDPALADWWTARQAEDGETPAAASPEPQARRSRRGGRRRRRKPAPAAQE